jgi:phage tail sheath protein FI
MPAQLTYPGVYVEEISSGVRAITGVATSVTAFVGRTASGPVEEPTIVTSFGDFDRRFGGLWKHSALGYSVRDFFANGGSIALIVRLDRGASDAEISLTGEDPPGPDAAAATVLAAADPGTWANGLRVRVDHDTKDPTDDDLFNLYVRDPRTGLVEEHRNVTIGVADNARDLSKVLANDSRLVRVKTEGTRPVASATPAAGEDPWDDNATATNATVSTNGSDGSALQATDFQGSGAGSKTGMYALEKADIFNLLVIPPYKTSDTVVDTAVIGDAAKFCESERAMLVVDPLASWSDPQAVAGLDLSSVVGTKSKNAALYFPMLLQPDPLREGQVREFPPSGAAAGVMARTDAQRGVWKAPAGQDATLVGVPALDVPLTDAEIGLLNPKGINSLRALPAAGRVVWGARTMDGDDRLASEWKYVPVRRTALFIEESLYRGTQWVVFEPNDEPLWAQIRLNVGTFMNNMFRQGAFQGKTPRDAYFVKCDKETTTQADIDLGIVNIQVGFAPLKPAEFVVIKLQQIAGQSQS